MPEFSVKNQAVVAPPAPAASAGTTMTVLEALAAIWQDSRDAPETYLDDTGVPYGGE